MKTTLLILALLFSPTVALSQTTEQLQKQIIDLQSQLLACQSGNSAKVSDPIKEALEAYQTFLSTVDTGVNHHAYMEALIPLKITVDRLQLPSEPSCEGGACPNSSLTYKQVHNMKQVLAYLVSAGGDWNLQVSYGSNTGKTMQQVLGQVNNSCNTAKQLMPSKFTNEPTPTLKPGECLVNNVALPCSAR